MAIGAAGCALALASCGGEATATVQVVWYGTVGGVPTAGTTPVEIQAAYAGSGPFAVESTGSADAPADAQWDAAVRTGATTAILTLGLDPRGRTLRYQVPESIGGPSAGALLAVASMAALRELPVDGDATLTGTIYPDGSIGEVTGIPDKMRAARDAGLTTFAYPAGVTSSLDTATGRQRDVAAYADELGLNAVAVSSVAQALPLFIGDTSAPAEASPPPVAEGLVELVSEATAACLARLTDPGPEVAPAVVGSPQERTDIVTAVESAVATATRQLAAGSAFEALATATLAERSIARWNAAQEAAATAGALGIEVATSRALAEIADAIATTERTRDDAAAVPTTSAEQLVALPDALGWATDALATLRVTADMLTAGVADAEELAGHAADVAQVGYDVKYYLPLSVAAVQVTPGAPVRDASASTAVLAAFTDLLIEAGEANVRYFRALAQAVGADEDLPDAALTTALGEALASDAPTRSDLTGSALTKRASTAVSYWVQSTALVANAGTVTAGPRSPDDDARRRIDDTAAFERRLALAVEGNTSASRVVAAEGYNPSYLVWGTRWGAALAADPATTDSTRLEGLVYLWYTSVTGRMLRAVGGA